MTADADVALVAGALHDAWLFDPDTPGWMVACKTCDRYFLDEQIAVKTEAEAFLREHQAAAVLSALAGRLLPEGGDTRKAYLYPGSFSLLEDLAAEDDDDWDQDPTTATHTRTVTRFPDGSELYGPWTAIDDERRDVIRRLLTALGNVLDAAVLIVMALNVVTNPVAWRREACFLIGVALVWAMTARRALKRERALRTEISEYEATVEVLEDCLDDPEYPQMWHALTKPHDPADFVDAPRPGGDE